MVTGCSVGSEYRDLGDEVTVEMASRFDWQKGAENHGSTKHIGNVTLTAGYEPIAGIFSDRSAAVTQPVTFSALRKSRRAGDFVIGG